MRKLFLSLVFLSVLLSIHANPGIKGIVIDQTTRKALDYGRLTFVLYDGDHIVEEAMTEANGSFLIQPVKPGTYSIRIHFLASQRTSHLQTFQYPHAITRSPVLYGFHCYDSFLRTGSTER